MSVILTYRDKKSQFATMVADRMVSFPQYELRVIGDRQKAGIGKNKDYSVGGVGNIKFVSNAVESIISSNLTAQTIDNKNLFLKWISSTDDIFDDSSDDEAGELLFLTYKNITYVDSNGSVVYINDNFFAIGAGATYALGAMKMESIKLRDNINEENIQDIFKNALHIVAYYCASVSDPYLYGSDNGSYDIISIKGDKNGRHQKRTKKS